MSRRQQRGTFTSFHPLRDQFGCAMEPDLLSLPTLLVLGEIAVLRDPRLGDVVILQLRAAAERLQCRIAPAALVLHVLRINRLRLRE